ncbi:hypothetical protein, partial, partial [Parasitella parasitica]
MPSSSSMPSSSMPSSAMSSSSMPSSAMLSSPMLSPAMSSHAMPASSSAMPASSSAMPASSSAMPASSSAMLASSSALHASLSTMPLAAAVMPSISSSTPSISFATSPTSSAMSSASTTISSASSTALAITATRRDKGKGRATDSVPDSNDQDNSQFLYSRCSQEGDIEDDDDEYTDIEDESEAANNDNDGIVRPTRVLKDIFHAMDMLKLPLRHGAHKEFMRNYRDALFIFDEDDKKRVIQVLDQHFKMSFRKMWARNPTWILERVKRVVPPPDVLLPIVEKLFDTFGNLRCSKSGNKLFDKHAWKKAENIKKSIRLGHLSDPVGVPLYFRVKEDKFGLTIYRCVRGTNSVEGGIHTNIIRKFGFYNASPDLTECAL